MNRVLHLDVPINIEHDFIRIYSALSPTWTLPNMDHCVTWINKIKLTTAEHEQWTLLRNLLMKELFHFYNEPDHSPKNE